MACGTPVIVSSTTSLPEVVGEAGILVNPMDVNEIARAMHSVNKNGNLRRELRQRGIERSHLFSWERTAALTSKVLEEAAEQGK
jgi:glycosyltransferase involved in cell wall biosynthesis